VHFIGIGGSGMSGLARMLLDGGAIVSGSEPNPNKTTFELTKRGVKISRDQVGELLSKEIDLVVRTAAVPDHNREFTAAKALGIKSIKYAEMLGQVMAERFGVAVAGTHGKSTTTAMISYALLTCGGDPSFVVGGTVPQLGRRIASGASNLFVAEACEYDRSYHNLRPRVALLMNIEEDHLDCYKDIDDIVQSFRAFCALVPGDGLIVANGADENVARVVAGQKARVERVALAMGSIGRRHRRASRTAAIAGRSGITEGRRPAEAVRCRQHNLFNATMASRRVRRAGSIRSKPRSRQRLYGSRSADDAPRRHVQQRDDSSTDTGHPPDRNPAQRSQPLATVTAPSALGAYFSPHQHRADAVSAR
jgi:UDP-N-acetylmuramate-alanine ligase